MSIKQTLAYSLHEVAKILQDQQLVEAELVPVFEHFIQASRYYLLRNVYCIVSNKMNCVFFLSRKSKPSKWA